MAPRFGSIRLRSSGCTNQQRSATRFSGRHGALAAALGGLDLLVFTRGIGERAAPVRWEICQQLSFLGVQLDASRNAAQADVISAPASRCAVRVIPTKEELMIARHTTRLLRGNAPDSRANEIPAGTITTND
jgi:acetate kinase